MHSVLSAIIRDDRLDLIQPLWALHVAVCVLCVQWPDQPCDQLQSSHLMQTVGRFLSISRPRRWIRLRVQYAWAGYPRTPARLPPYARVPDGRVEGPGGSHQRAVRDELGQTSFVRRQGCLDLVTDITIFSSTYQEFETQSWSLVYSLSLLYAVNTIWNQREP